MGAVGVPPDEQASGPADEDRAEPAERESEREAERVIRHRMTGHKAALELAEQLERPESLAPHVEETEHRLAEDEDILDEIGSDDD